LSEQDNQRNTDFPTINMITPVKTFLF